MKSDFSRISFDASRQYTTILYQQGRAQTDADFNEDSAIHAHFREALAASLTGTEGAIFFEPSVLKPLETLNLPGFRLVLSSQFEALRTDVKKAGAADGTAAEREAAAAATDGLEVFKKFNCWISPGHYYADGLRCENDAWVPLEAQPYLPEKFVTLPQRPENPDLLPAVIFYLDAWERPVSWLDEPSISDIALGAGVDTTMRTQLIWQVKAVSGPLRSREGEGRVNAAPSGFPAWLAALPWFRDKPRLRVRIKPGQASSDPCRPEFASAWQGLENQLFRVEIHEAAEGGLPTFKWSRENGSVVALVRELHGSQVRIFPGQLKAGGFRPGDWLEIVRKGDELIAKPGDLVQVASIRGDLLTLEKRDDGKAPSAGDKLRRWDQHSCESGAIPVTYGWIDLEDGIQVCFMPATGNPPLPQEGAVSPRATDPDYDKKIFQGTTFYSGDYWVFTARTAIASVEWPDEPAPEATIPANVSAQFSGTDLTGVLFGNPVPVRINGQPPLPADPKVPAALPPHGGRHRYALLASAIWRVAGDRQEAAWQLDDLRRILSLTEIVPEYRKVTPAQPTPTVDPANPNPTPATGDVVVSPGRKDLGRIVLDTPKAKITTIVGRKAVEVDRKQLEKVRLSAETPVKVTGAKSKKTTEKPK